MPMKWTEEEDLYLLSNYPKHDSEFVAKVLNRSSDAIRIRHKTLQKQKAKEPLIEESFFLERAKRTSPKHTRNKIKGTIKTTKVSKYKRGSAYAHTKTGYRPDLDMVVRSGWEADVLRLLKSFDIPYKFEPRVFTYPIKRGNKAYIPDIYLPRTDQWLEVKGYMDKNSKIKLKRFAKYYPDEFKDFIMIIGNSKANREFCEEIGVPIILDFTKIKKLYSKQITNWETK